MKGQVLAVLVRTILVACIAWIVAVTAASAQQSFTFEELTIEGQAQKPQVSFILNRSSKINLDVDIRRFKPAFSRKNEELLVRYSKLFEMK